jgi:hypothetical protein
MKDEACRLFDAAQKEILTAKTLDPARVRLIVGELIAEIQTRDAYIVKQRVLLASLDHVDQLRFTKDG